MTDSKSIYDALRAVQVELKAPKGQRNSFGNYNYRSSEDILEAVKPVLKNHNLTLVVSDDLVNIGDRYYIKATASVSDGADVVEAHGYARESETKKGMDDSQITGATSSYARKYALNGLFLIDDTKDADTDEHRAQSTTAPKTTTNVQAAKKVFPDAEVQYAETQADKPKGLPVSTKQLQRINATLNELGITEREDKLQIVTTTIGRPVESSKDMTMGEAKKVIDKLIGMQEAA